MSTTFYPKVDGTTTAVADLMVNLSERGHQVQLLTRRFANTAKEECWKGLQISRVEPAKKSALSRIMMFVNQLVVGSMIIKRSKIELIHTNSFISLYAALILGRFFRIPTVLTFNGSQRIWRPEARWQSEADLAITMPFESLALKKSDAIIVQSEPLKSQIVELYGVKDEKVRVIPHPVDLETFKPSSDHEKEENHVALFVGTLGRIHGADLFVRSITPVVKEFPKARFILVGTGPLRDSLEKIVNETNVRSSVEFVGKVYDRGALSALYQKSKVVVIPVRYPSRILTKVASEAMACAKPIVTTMDLDENLLRHGIILSRTDPADIADAILKVFKMENHQYETACLAARSYVEQHCSKSAVTQLIEQIYHILTKMHKSD